MEPMLAHVWILVPTENEDVFVNWNNHHSINVQIICDNKSHIINIVDKWPESVHDLTILKESPLCGLILTPLDSKGHFKLEFCLGIPVTHA